MVELPNWVGTALEVFSYVVFGPFLILYAVFGAGCIIVSVAYPIWCAIRGHDANGALHPITRLVLGILGFGLLYPFIAPWL